MDFFGTITFTKEALEKLCEALRKQEEQDGKDLFSWRTS